MENPKELKVTADMVVLNPELQEGQMLDIIGDTCPRPMPTSPPPGYAPNSTVYCDKGEWKWINGEIA
jgi:hypothetical protein